MAKGPLFVGLDLGTGGGRALAVTQNGQVAAAAAVELATPDGVVAKDGSHEQDANAWWSAATEALQRLVVELALKKFPVAAIRSIAVDGTSGTVVGLDRDGRPTGPALMYNDGRAAREAEELNEAARDTCRKLGYRIAASYAIAKILWIQRSQPQVFAAARRFVHQADFIAGRLSGNFDVTDYSNALKTGYDLLDESWPGWLEKYDGIRERLPQVVAPGTKIGTVLDDVARQLGLPLGLAVVSGATDGTAAFLASGARRAGDDNTTLGTTLVFKRLWHQIATHPDGLIYSHKLPGGFWLPGAASNTGADWIQAQFPDSKAAALDASVAELFPVAHLAYPLAKPGERFPLKSAEARGFCEPETDDPRMRYAANLQGTALVERLGYEVLDAATGPAVGEVYATGGGSRSDVWLQIRADVTGRTFHRPVCHESAFGSAVLAAAGAGEGDIWSAAERMVRIERTFKADPSRTAVYDEYYRDFKNLLIQGGYLDSPTGCR